ncbi:MAG: glycosyl hydrolase family 95 catalytic domain-containing protein [Chitinophagaceae bacterium]
MIRFLFIITGLVSLAYAQQKAQPLRLWYKQPAVVWEEALPLGNAKTGAMVFGGVKTERIQLNDNTLWSGYPSSGNNVNAPKVLPEVRKAIFEGDYSKASELWKQMQGPYSARYLPMGDVHIQHHFTDSTTSTYERSLDLNNAIATVQYTINNIQYKRETFTSYPNKVMVIKLTASKKASLSFDVSLSSKLHFQVQSNGNKKIILQGKAPIFVAHRTYQHPQISYDSANGEGTYFQIHVQVKHIGGEVISNNGKLTVKNADAVVLYITEATSFNGFDKSPGLQGKNPSIEANENMHKAFAKSYNELKLLHIKDHQSLFNRVDFALKNETNLDHEPTDKRLINYQGNDLGLQVLLYQYGRYLMIASSRKGSRPANLQGIWNDHVQPPWGSNYTLNINTEMNYWLAENTNLSECHEPLFNFIKELSINGAKTAKINYGINEGWVTHHNSDLWAISASGGGGVWDPRGFTKWSAWPMAGAWLSTHLYEHYLFTGNKKFLADTAYPLMKGAAQFMLHWLITDPQSGYLVTNPSTSPENTVKIEGKEYQVSMASTMDISIIRELFTCLIKSAEILQTDEAFKNTLLKTRDNLYPLHIGQFGQLQEWYKDWDDPNDKHRHISHLYSLFPGNQISVAATPEIAKAAKQTLLQRGDSSTGWSMAWKINWWARLYDGNHAYKVLQSVFNYINPLQKVETITGGGGSYPNLLGAYPFQIDGNFGLTAGITEMLLQSYHEDIHLLPALPNDWAEGSIHGIKARGNFTIDINWKNHHLTKAIVISNIGGNCRIKTSIPVKVIETTYATATKENANILNQKPFLPNYKKNKQAVLTNIKTTKGYVIDFKTEKGKKYTLVPLSNN